MKTESMHTAKPLDLAAESGPSTRAGGDADRWRGALEQAYLRGNPVDVRHGAPPPLRCAAPAGQSIDGSARGVGAAAPDPLIPPGPAAAPMGATRLGAGSRDRSAAEFPLPSATRAPASRLSPSSASGSLPGGGSGPTAGITTGLARIAPQVPDPCGPDAEVGQSAGVAMPDPHGAGPAPSPRHLHVQADGEGVTVWLRDGALSASDARSVKDRLIRALAGDGQRLARLHLNGRCVYVRPAPARDDTPPIAVA